MSSEFSIETLPRRRFPWASVVAVLLVATVGAAVYLVLGWQRMEAACMADAAVPAEAAPGVAELGWSWDPLGFACTWDSKTGDESITRSSLWWG